MKRVPGAAPASLPELIRAKDRMSFLYVDRCLVNREDNAITVKDKRGTAHVPATAIASLLLGPGTSITHQAMVLLADSGTAVLWVGEGMVRFYAHGRAMSSRTSLLEAQAEIVTNQRKRLEVAREMYRMRFSGEDVSGLSMQQLRGREGVRMQRLYREHATRSGVEWESRRFTMGEWDSTSPINQALSSANSCLYGAVLGAINALGCSPGLGVVHTGHEKSFVYDIADLYKAEITIPAAFDVVSSGADEPGDAVRAKVREAIKDTKLMRRCVEDIKTLLSASDAILDGDVVYLWDDQEGAVQGGVVYLDPSMPEPTAYSSGEQPWSS